MKGVRWYKNLGEWTAKVGYFSLRCCEGLEAGRPTFKAYVHFLESTRYSLISHEAIKEAKLDAEQLFMDILESLHIECCAAMLRVGLDPEAADEGR
jgi:hypothetical protein